MMVTPNSYIDKFLIVGATVAALALLLWGGVLGAFATLTIGGLVSFKVYNGNVTSLRAENAAWAQVHAEHVCTNSQGYDGCQLGGACATMHSNGYTGQWFDLGALTSAVAADVESKVTDAHIDLQDHVTSNPMRQGELCIVLGYESVNGAVDTSKPVAMVVPDDTHLAVIGPTGSGKSVSVRGIVYQALLPWLYPETRGAVVIAASDISGVTFNPALFNKLPMLFGGRVATNIPETVALVGELHEEMTRRAKLFNECKGYPEKLSEYNALQVTGKRLPVILCFMEEASALLAGKNKELKESLTSLLWQCRKFGIIIVLLGQNVKKEVIGDVRDSLLVRVHFKQPSRTVLEMLEMNPRATLSSNVPGRGLFLVKGREGELKAPLVSKEALIALIELLCSENPLPTVYSEHELAVFNAAMSLRLGGVLEPTVAQVQSILGPGWDEESLLTALRKLGALKADDAPPVI